MDIQQFLAIAIVGTILSLLIQLLKKNVADSIVVKLLTLSLSIVVASIFVWVQGTPYVQTVFTVLGTASTVYGFFLKND